MARLILTAIVLLASAQARAQMPSPDFIPLPNIPEAKTGDTKIPVTMPKGTEVLDAEQARSSSTGATVSLEQPIDPRTYVCGPGDVFELNFWGPQNFRLRIGVDVEGRTFISKVGYVDVTGKTLAAVRTKVKEKVRASYPGLQFDLTLTGPRTFLVHIAGSVKSPGSYITTPIERVASLLARAGGVTSNGSRRQIAIQHKNGKESIADLLQYELTGDIAQNPYLLDGDVITVRFPDVVATITGAVYRPGTYELIKTKDIAELVRLAGGVKSTVARRLPLRILRLNDRQQQTFRELSWGSGGATPNEALRDGDRVWIRGVEELQRTVQLMGAVAGADPIDMATTATRLAYVEGDTVMSLIDRAGGIRAPGDLRRSYISRQRKNAPPELIAIDLEALLVRREFSADKKVRIGDTIVVPPTQYSVLVQGAVARAGLYPFNPLFGIREYIAHAGGRTRTARDFDEVQLIDANGHTHSFKGDLKPSPGDAILVPERNFSRPEIVQIVLGAAGVILEWGGDHDRTDAMTDNHEQDLFLVLLRRWRTIAIALGVGIGAAVGYSLIATKWFEARLAVVPSQRSHESAAMSLASKLPGMDTVSTDSKRVEAVLTSYSVADEVIDKFKLDERYGQQHRAYTRKALWNHCKTSVDRKSGVVVLICEDKDPELAMLITSYFGEVGNEVFRRVSTTSAHEEAKFLETQVVKAQHDVDVASRKLREFQEQHKIVDLPEQAKAVISAMASIKGELLSKQLELSYLSSFAAKGESGVMQLREQIGIMESKLRQLETSQNNPPAPASAAPPTGSAKAPTGSAAATTKNDKTSDFFPDAMNVPELRYQLEQLVRDQKIQETVFLLMTQRYEMAKIESARDTSTFQILDKPTKPTVSSRPKLKKLLILGGFGGLIAAGAWIMGPLWWRRKRAALHQPG